MDVRLFRGIITICVDARLYESDWPPTWIMKLDKLAVASWKALSTSDKRFQRLPTELNGRDTPIAQSGAVNESERPGKPPHEAVFVSSRTIGKPAA